MPATQPKKRATEDEDDDQGEPGAWVLGTWHCYYSLSLCFVASVKGKPMADWHPTSAVHQAYRWNSYHAARKFQRAHPQLAGYLVLNLAEIQQQAARQREIHEEWIHAGSKAAV